jgi:hypothetical protein
MRREYIVAKGRRWQSREAFRRNSRRQRPGRPVVYPPELADIPPFADWLKERVEHAQRSGEHLEEDIKQYACPPERYATSHRQMYSFGMHLRVRSCEGGLVIRDSCVVAAFTQQLRWGIRNGRPIERTSEHVGFIEEILELDYRNHCTTVLVCDWVKPTRDMRFPNIERDKYGFTVANFSHMDKRVHSDSFAFPLHCQQVFLSDDPTRRGWKVVLRTDVRGRRLLVHSPQPAPGVIAVGNDDDFRGLQPTILETEPHRRPADTGGSYVTPGTNTTAPETQEDEPH